MSKRHLPTDRKAAILDIALVLARSIGYKHVTREAIGERVGCAPSLISAYWGTMPQMRRAIMSAAVARRDLAVIAQGLTSGDSKAKTAPADVKREALERLL